jgi:hypothetical protein
MANFDVGAMRLLVTSDGLVVSFDRSSSKPLEFHFGVDRKRLTTGQYEKLWIHCEAQGILAMFYLDQIGLGKVWNDVRGRARIGGATSAAKDAPDAIRISHTAGQFRGMTRELYDARCRWRGSSGGCNVRWRLAAEVPCEA